CEVAPDSAALSLDWTEYTEPKPKCEPHVPGTTLLVLYAVVESSLFKERLALEDEADLEL
ncbi:hypothetical protein L9G16_19655, partial [Shewanella sp. A25]|nr:hypothetical protein [Shewanella shenzhenensis]